MAGKLLLLKPWHINYYSVVGFQLQFASKLQLRLLHVEITFDTLIRDAWKFHETFHNIAFYVYLIWAEWETIFFGTERMTKDYTRTVSGVKKYTQTKLLEYFFITVIEYNCHFSLELSFRSLLHCRQTS